MKKLIISITTVVLFSVMAMLSSNPAQAATSITVAASAPKRVLSIPESFGPLPTVTITEEVQFWYPYASAYETVIVARNTETKSTNKMTFNPIYDNYFVKNSSTKATTVELNKSQTIVFKESLPASETRRETLDMLISDIQGAAGEGVAGHFQITLVNVTDVFN